MSNKQIENLTFRLLQALDKDYDVVNMEAVLSVIGALENATITKEQLEATRLAKYINLFRRRTTSEQLAKRAKSLLKKWREMVGMQQNVNETPRIESFQTRENPSQPTLSLGINTLECGPLRNNDTLYNNRIANLSNHYVDKKLEMHRGDGRVPNMSVPSIAFGKTQPTSFANLLTGFSTVCADKINTIPITTQTTTNGPNVRRKIRNSIRNSNLSTTLTDGINVETSNSNSALNYAPFSNQTKLNTTTEPIVIDIEDSNSSSNIISNDLPSKEGDAISFGTSTGNKANKHKKTKKEKKRTKERESLNEVAAPVVVIDHESSESQQPQWRKIESSKNVGKSIPMVIDEKSRNSIKLPTNISEILSLSNSSMSSVFPSSSVGETKNVFLQLNNHPLPETELSFAGKFTPQNIDTSKTTGAGATSSGNATHIFHRNDNNEGSEKTIAMIPVANKFHLFSESGHNSNDSASNSRHSNFEVVDSISQQVHLSQPQIATTIETTSIPEQKVPKKRGRKKGSKGVDSLIAKDTSLSSQMLMQTLSSGSKKVKTTKELYAEMQNRKLGVSTPTTPSHWAGAHNQSFVRRDSFCSEPSLHSPRTFDACSTNATVSTAATGSTPEKSALQRRTAEIDSESDSVISGGLSHESVTPLLSAESAENKQESSNRLQHKLLPGTSTKKKDDTNVLIAVENKLRNIIQKMPAIPSKLNIEKEISNDIVPCTCKIIEILPEQHETFETDASAMSNLLSLDALKSANTLGDESEKPVITISVAESNIIDLKTTNSVSVTSKETTVIEAEQQEKPKKSIFDLDFDEDEDPLNTLIAEVAAASDNTKTERAEEQNMTDVFPHDQINHQIIEEGQSQMPEQQTSVDGSHFSLMPNIIPRTIYPTYKIVEDDACLAKQRFELQTQKITNFHINALHNFYIPNVNGNWDNSSIYKRKEDVTETEIMDCSDVVPKISNLWGTDEQIRKDLRDMNFDRKFKPKKLSKNLEQLIYTKPFLGVARGLKSAHRKTRRHRQTNQQYTELNEHKETNQKDLDSISEIVGDSVKNANTVTLESTINVIKEEATQNLVFNDITINVDDINSKHKSDGIDDAQTPTLLTIASNVNFNNNQIGDSTLSRINMNNEKTCTKKSDDDPAVIGAVNLNDDDRIAYCSNGGDIQNNNIISNKCNNLDKLEESSCESHSSLKQTQKSINLKLRKHRRQLLEQEQNSPKSYSKRKRRRKESQGIAKKPKVKCIKIAINGGITTQRHITFKNSSEDDEDDDKNNYSCVTSAADDDTDPETVSDGDDGTVFFVESGEENNEHASEDGEWEREQINDFATTGLHNATEIDDFYGGEDNDNDDEDDDDDDDDYEEEEIEEDDEYFGEFHEVVTRDISPSTESGNNHIVLTIKKTPSKTNSPSNSLSAMSPVTSSNIKFSNKVTNMVKIEINKKDSELVTQVDKKPPINGTGTSVVNVPESINNPHKDNETSNNFSLKTPLENFTRRNYLSDDLKRKRHIKRRKIFKLPQFRFPNERSKGGERIFKKLHQQLFFPHEIFAETDEKGCKQRIFNISSCSSSCAEESDYEYESGDDNDYKKSIVAEAKTDCLNNIVEITKKSDSNESDNENISRCNSNENLTDIDSVDLSKNEEQQQHTINSEIKSESNSDSNELPNENNGYLVSFNNICVSNKVINETYPSKSTVSTFMTTDNTFVGEEEQQLQQDKQTLRLKPNKYDNLVNTTNTTSHNNVTENEIHLKSKMLNSSSETTVKNPAHNIALRPEYCTGFRTIEKTINDEDRDGNLSSQLEKFKEWHQILQVRSYNDELLTVLPYVVLD